MPTLPTALNPDLDPETLALERALLGGCLSEGTGPAAWPSRVQPGEFLLDRHATIWGIMRDLTETVDRPDTLLVAHELARRGQFADIGGPAYLALLLEEGCLAYALDGYADRIRTASLGRYRRALAAQLANDPHDAATLEHLLAGEGQGTEIRLSLAQAAEERPRPAITTGLPGLDRMTGGIRPGTVTVLGGRTSHGKSSFLAELAYRMASQGTSVDVLELEETAYRIAQRLTLHRGTDPDWLPISIIRLRGGVSEAAVVASVAASPADVVILDHVQQIPTPGAWSRAYGLEQLLSRLAHVAVRGGKALLVAAQLNRGMEARKDEPTLADLRDSGSLEQIARQVWLVYWPAKHDSSVSPNEYVVTVAKHSEGPTGRLLLTWDAVTGRFWDRDGAPR